DFATMQRLRRFSRYWDLYSNSGNFSESLPLLWPNVSPFESFLSYSDWLYAKLGRHHAIALHDLAEQLFTYLTVELRHVRTTVARAIWRDYQRCGRSDRPAFLVGVIELPMMRKTRASLPPRQARHLVVPEVP